METKRIIHPVDLQDREGFLRFLTDQAREGWEAVKVTVNATWFRRTDRPPKGYAMWLDPNGGTLRDPAKRAMWESREDVERENAAVLAHRETLGEGWTKVATHHWALELYATPEPSPAQVPDWEWAALENRAVFDPGGFDVLRGVKGLVIPVLALAMLMSDAMGMGALVMGLFWPILALVGILLCAGVILAAELLATRVQAQHRAGLIQARREGRRYTTPEEVARRVPLKNRLEFWARGLRFAEIALLALVLILWL